MHGIDTSLQCYDEPTRIAWDLVTWSESIATTSLLRTLQVNAQRRAIP